MVVIFKRSYQKKPSLLITHNLNKKISSSKQIKVKNTLKFLTDCAENYRNTIMTTIIGITGSCGKTTLKQLLGQSLSKITKHIILQNLIIINLVFL